MHFRRREQLRRPESEKPLLPLFFVKVVDEPLGTAADGPASSFLLLLLDGEVVGTHKKLVPSREN